MKTLREIKIEGFKSIERANLELGDLNVVIGANGAGKSNLMGAFRLLERVLSRRLQVFVASKPDRFLFHGRKTTPALSLNSMKTHPARRWIPFASIVVLILALIAFPQTSRGNDAHARLQESISLFNQGNELDEQDKLDEALAIYDQLDQRFGQDKSADVREQVASGLVNKIWILNKQGKFDAALAVSAQIEARFGRDKTAIIQSRIAAMLINKSVSLRHKGQIEAEIATLDLIEQRYGQSKFDETRRYVAQALLYKGRALGKQKKTEKSLALYDLADARYGHDDFPDTRAQVAEALVTKAIALKRLGKTQAAIAIYDQIEFSFGEDDDEDVQTQVEDARKRKARTKSYHPQTKPDAHTLFSKAVSLVQSGEAETALARFAQLDARFGGDQSAEIQNLLALALANKGMTLNQLGRHQAAIAVSEYSEARYDHLNGTAAIMARFN